MRKKDWEWVGREEDGNCTGLRHLADKAEKVIKLYPTVAINYRLPLTRPEFQNSSLSTQMPHCLKLEAAKCKYLANDGCAPTSV